MEAAGNTKLIAQALNNVEVTESDQYKYKENYTPSTATNSHLYGQIVTTDATFNEEVKKGKTEVSFTSITGADPLGQGTVIKVNNNAKEYCVTTKDYNDLNATTYTPVVGNKKFSGTAGKIFGYGNCTYTWTETQMHSTSSTYTIKGDKPIDVGFMTGGSGDISVTSAKDMYLAGNISNASNFLKRMVRG